MPMGIGLPEIAIVLVIVLVIFGPKRLPELGKSLGSGMKSFKDSVTNDHDDDKKLSSGTEAKPEPVRTEAKPEPVRTEAKPEPVRTEAKPETPATGGQGS